VKPTVQAAVPQSETSPTPNYDVGPYRVEAGRRKLWKGNELVQLSPKAFDLLVLLVAERHRVIDKDELMRRLWPDTVVGEESVTQSISALRRALGDDSANPQFIATVPRRGYQFIGPITEAAGDGEAAAAPSPVPPEPAVVPAGSGVRWQLLVILLLATAAISATAVWMLRQPASAPAVPIRFSQEPPPGTTIASGGVLSPDGRNLAFVARDQNSGILSLWVRDLNNTAPRQLEGTEGATRPFWAPDGGALGFFSQGLLRTVSLGDGIVRTLAVVGPLPLGGTWGPRNTIIFGNRRSGLTAVSVDTGEQRRVTTLDRERGESGHRLPQFLPDGEHFIYTVTNAAADQGGAYLGSLSGDAPRRLLPSTAEGVVYAEPGFLLYVTDGRLVAHPFDTARLQPEGQPETLATGVDAPLVTNATTISASTTGLLTYGGGVPRVRLIWYDGKGATLSRVDGPVELHNPVITPDGALVLASQVFSARRGVWAIDTRGGGSRVVTDGTRAFPSPDGRQVAFSADASGVLDLHVRDIGGTTASTLVASPYPKTITHWTADGRYIVFVTSNPRTMEDLWVLPMFGDRQPMPFLETQDNEFQGEVSPDGRWMAYTSDESGTWEVYVQRFPSGGDKRAVSVDGGFEPHWRRSGNSNRLFYIASNQAIAAVDFNGDDIGAPQQLFEVALANDQPTLFRNQFAVSADGSRFLIDSNDGPGNPITVLLNWPQLASK
jgi:DNA-binding winged helix-turn-helix (wHTH) protein/Tol biopolymer transport system component